MQPSVLDQLTQQNNNNFTNLTGGVPVPQDVSAQSGTPQQSVIPSNPAPTIDNSQSTAQQPTSTPANSGNGGNWFTHLLPTIGSIGGGIVGSLIPGLGETGISEVGGSAAGGAIGKGLENVLEGKSDVGNGVLESGAEGLAGGVGGKVLGAGLNLGAKAIGGVAKAGIANATAKAGAQAASDTATGISKIYDLGKNAAQDLRPGYGRGALDLTDEMGVNKLDPNQVLDAANTSLKHFGNLRDEMLSKMTPVNASGVADEAGNMVQPSVRQLVASALSNKNPVTGEMMGTPRTNILGDLGPIGQRDLASGSFVGSFAKGTQQNGSTNFLRDASNALSNVIDKQNVSPKDFLSAQQTVGNIANKAFETANRTGTAEDMANAAAWSDLNKGLKNMLYGDQSVGDFLAGTKGVLTADDTGGNEALANFLNNRTNALQTGQDINDNLSQLIDLRDTAKAGVQNLNDPGSAGTKYLLDLQNGKINADGSPITVPAGKQGLTQMAANAIGAVGKGGNTSQVASKLADTLTSTSKFLPGGSMNNAGALGLIGGNLIANSPNLTQPAGSNSAIQLPTDMPTQQTILGTNSPMGEVASTELLANMNPWSGAHGFDQAGTQAINAIQHNNSLMAQLPALIQAYNAAGGAQGGIMGHLAELGGMITGGPSAQYQARANALQQELEAATGQHIILPSLTMNQTAANSALSQLSGILQSNTGAGSAIPQ